MTLTTHALVGATAATAATVALGPTPTGLAVAFAAGFVSHLCVDAIPHWDYKIDSLEKDYRHPLNTRVVVNKHFWPNVMTVAADALLGFVLSAVVFSLWLFHVPLAIILVGVFGALVPDGLHFIYFKTHTRFLVLLERFHNWIQKYSPLNIPAWVGLGLQCALVAALICVLKISGVVL
jgi:hypothetical protein